MPPFSMLSSLQARALSNIARCDGVLNPHEFYGGNSTGMHQQICNHVLRTGHPQFGVSNAFTPRHDKVVPVQRSIDEHRQLVRSLDHVIGQVVP